MKTNKFLIALSFMAFGLSACTYDVFVPEPVDESIVYSFSTDVQQEIFNNDCIDCHDGSFKFSLKDGEAYDNIVPDRVNLDNPEESIIYTFPLTGSGSVHPASNNYKGSDANVVLQWIKQGAQNN